MQGDLTDLDNVQAWLGQAGSNAASIPLLQNLITAASSFILGAIDRDTLGKRQVVNTVDGNGQNFLILREWPVLSVDQVVWEGRIITQQAQINPRIDGIMLEEPATSAGQQRLTLLGYCFPRGRSNIQLTYTAGYFVAGEAQTIPSVGAPQIATRKFWTDDGGVVSVSGTTFTAVDGAPAQGQYSVADGLYVFNAADAGTKVLVSYSYVPPDLVQATTELVGERFKAKDRIGLTGQSLAGKESITYFSGKDLNGFARSALQPYKRVTPA